MTEFAPAPAHGPIEELFPDVFVVRGSMPIAPLVTIPRNMVILRQGRELTLVNSVRLSVAGEQQLQALGEIKHLVKLGHFHTRDDPYYRATFAPTFWAPQPADSATNALLEGEASPVDAAQVFRFAAARFGEAALVLRQPSGNLLLTCDSVQNWTDTSGCSLMGAMATRFMGLVKPAKIGPLWAKQMTENQPAALRPDFERLLQHDFAHLMAGHGSLLRNDAKQCLQQSCIQTFGK